MLKHSIRPHPTSECRRTLSVPAILVLAAFAASPALAQGRPETSLVDRARGSDLVVVGEVEDVQATWQVNDYGDRLIVSSVRLRRIETLKGQPRPSVTVEVEGGSIDGVTLRVSDLPAFSPGERAVFFLSQSARRTFVPHLRGEGIMKLDRNDQIPGTGLSLDEIRESVAAAGTR